MIRAAEPFIDTRLVYESKSLKELERLTFGKNDEVYSAFAELAKKNFQQIVYGSEDDVVGIHIISYFLSRATPILRDRPVERPTRGNEGDKGQFLFRNTGVCCVQSVTTKLKRLCSELISLLQDCFGR